MQIVVLHSRNARKFTRKVFQKLEEKGVHAAINRESMAIEFEADDPYTELKANDVIRAMAVGGMRSAIAFRLFSDEYMLKIIDLDDVLRSKKDVHRVMGRIIGTKGKTKKFIEEITETNINMFEDKIVIIGMLEGVELASDAVEAFIRGAPHKKVYRLLEAGRRGIKEAKMQLWKE